MCKCGGWPRRLLQDLTGTQFGRRIWGDRGPVLLVIFFLNTLQWATLRWEGLNSVGPWLLTAAGLGDSGFPEVVTWSHVVPRVHVSSSFRVDSVHLNFSSVLLIIGLVPSPAPSPFPHSPFSLLFVCPELDKACGEFWISHLLLVFLDPLYLGCALCTRGLCPYRDLRLPEFWRHPSHNIIPSLSLLPLQSCQGWFRIYFCSRCHNVRGPGRCSSTVCWKGFLCSWNTCARI